MPMRIPEADNPYRVDIERTNTSVDSVGLVAAPEAKNATVNAVQGLTKSSFDVLEKAQKFKKLQDETQSLDLINQLKTEGEKLKNDSETGFKRLKGKDALSMPDGSSIHDTYNGRLQTIVRTLADKAGNPEVRATFNKFAQDYGYNFQNELNAHTIKQAQEYATSVQNNAIQLAYTDAVNGSTDDFINNLSVIKGIVDQNAKIKGVEPDYNKVLSQVYGSRTERLIDDGNLKEASALIKSGSDQGYIDAAHARHYNKVIKAERERQAKVAQVKNLTKAYLAKFTPEVVWKGAFKQITGTDINSEAYEKALDLAGGDPMEAMSIAMIGAEKYEQALAEYERTGKQPDFGDALPKAKKAQKMFASGLGSISGDINQTAAFIMGKDPNIDLETAYKVASNVARQQKHTVGVTQAERNNQLTILLEGIQKGTPLDDLPLASLNKIPARLKATYRRIESLNNSNSRMTDPAYYNEIRDPEKLKQMSPEAIIQIMPHLSEEDGQLLIRNAQLAQSGQLSDLSINSKKINQFLDYAGVGTETTDAKRRRGLLYQAIEDSLKDKQYQLGRKLTDEEIYLEGKRVLNAPYRVTDSGFIWDSEKDTSMGDVISGDGKFSPNKELLSMLDTGLDFLGVGEKNDDNRSIFYVKVLTNPRQYPQAIHEMSEAFKQSFPDGYKAFVDRFKERYNRAPSEEEVVTTILAGKTKPKPKPQGQLKPQNVNTYGDF